MTLLRIVTALVWLALTRAAHKVVVSERSSTTSSSALPSSEAARAPPDGDFDAMLTAEGWFRFESHNPYAQGQMLGCAAMKRVRVGLPFAHGQKKEVLAGELGGMPVVIARPYAGPFWLAGGDPALLRSKYEAYFRAERALMLRLESDFTPHFYGGCWTNFGATVHVEEHLRGFMDLAHDPEVKWKQRVRVAQYTVRLLTLFEHFPISEHEQRRAVYGDLFAKQFAVDADYHVKVVDLQSFFPYQGRGFGSSYRCTKHAHCQEKFWYASGYPNIMRGLRKLVPDDFGCDTERGLCRGLDTSTMLMAFCHMLIGPLFSLAPHDAPFAHATHAKTLISRCITRRRADRITPADLLAEFERLVPRDERLPRLSLTNDAERYGEIKAEFEAVRHQADIETLERFGAQAGSHHAVEDELENEWL